MSDAAGIRNPRPRSSVIAVVLLGLVAVASLLWLARGAARGARDAATAYSLDQPRDAAGEELQSASEGIPVLCYHYFRPGFSAGYTARVLGAVIFNLPTLGSREFWTIPVAEFERHLRLLREHGIAVVTLDEIAAAGETGAVLPRPAVVLTIDDADQSVYTLAYPALRRHGVRAHLFVPTALVGHTWGDLKLCDWEQLREMSDSGAILIESHTHDLHRKVEATGGWQPVFFCPDRLDRRETTTGFAAGGASPTANSLHPVHFDLALSRREITAHIGRAPRYLAWPYGFASTALDSVASSAGFAGTVSLKPNPWREDLTAWQIGRYAITAKTTPDVLFGLLPVAAAASDCELRANSDGVPPGSVTSSSAGGKHGR